MFRQKELLEIKNPKAIKFLSRNNFKALYYLKPFFSEARSLKEASIESYVSASSYYYWIKKFLDLGLIKTQRLNKQDKKKEIRYIASAKKFLLRVDENTKVEQFYLAASSEYSEQIVKNMSRSCEKMKTEIGFIFSRGVHGDLLGQIVSLGGSQSFLNLKDEFLKESSPASFAAWQEIPLKHADAKELQRRIAELLNEFKAKAKPTEGRYLIQMAIVPKD